MSAPDAIPGAAAPGAAPGAPGAQPQLTLDNASQAESLDQLEQVGQQLHGGAPGADPGQPGQVQVQQPNAVLIADTLKTARDTFCEISTLKAPRATLSDAACKQMGDLWGGWCDRRGIQVGKVLGNHHDTYLAALSTLSLAIAVYSATMAEIRVRRPVDVKATPGEGGSTTVVQPGAAAPAPAPTAATFVGGSGA